MERCGDARRNHGTFETLGMVLFLKKNSVMLLAIKEDVPSMLLFMMLCERVSVSLTSLAKVLSFLLIILKWRNSAYSGTVYDVENEKTAPCTCYKIARGDEVVIVYVFTMLCDFLTPNFAGRITCGRSLSNTRKRLFWKLSCHYILYLLHTFDLIAFNSRYDSDFHKIW